MTKFGEFPAERFRFSKVDVAHGKAVPLGQFCRKWARQLSHAPFPLSLRHFEFGHPKSFGPRHFHLIFVRSPLRFISRASHHKLARRAPAKLDADDLTSLAGLRAIERYRSGHSGQVVRCHSSLAFEYTGREQDD